MSMFALAFAVLGAGSPASAAPVLITATLAGSDCAGMFGDPNPPCDVGFGLDPEVAVSPWIIKYGANGTEDGINPEFPSIDGTEFSFGGGTWTYTPGPDDPAVRFWAAKGGPSFNLFWYVEGAGASGLDTPGVCAVDPYNLACLNLALAVTAGTYTAPGGAGLSHLTFYNAGPREVPEPAALALLGLGALGAGAARRLRKR